MAAMPKPKLGLMKQLVMVLLCLFLGGLPQVNAQTGILPHDEVEALREIGEQVGKKDWNFNVNPCSNDTSWRTPKSPNRPLFNNTLICNCSFTGGLCHVLKLFLKGQDLAGVLPPALAKLPYLQTADFTRNYLSGNIPREWTSMKQLEYLSITVNNLSGPVPDYVGNMTSLIYLSIENNLFSGNVPAGLGKLINLQNLILSTNNLTGVLPAALSNLTNLTEFRISSNNFSGTLPEFIQYWKNLQKLEIQASGLEGPIPSSISALYNLTELRISDFNGEGSGFPPLENMKGLTRLMLRGCNLNGTIPAYIAGMSNLKILDLSFNRLEGSIPNFEGLTLLVTILLAECLKNYPCSRDQYSLHINCGGRATTIGGITYESDQDLGGAAKFVPVGDNRWGISSTGDFWDVNTTSNDYIANNVSLLRMNDSELYTNARLSPLSLTYFARCLANGNYTVELHFSEIIFRDNRSFYSLGRRIFDVYIQEKLELKDFDIEKEAQGVDKVVIKKFNKVQVKNNILEIRFHWSGKGTTAAPKRGTYGPLISAISVNSEFKPPDDSKRTILIVVGAIISVLCLISTILCILWRKGYFEGSPTREQELRGLDIQTGFFTYRQIKAATNNFDPKNKIGEGGFGSVYKGILLDGTIIAVKQLSSKSKQGNREFVNEIGLISGLQHRNLVRLYGCCIEGNQLLLVYEFMENNSLACALFGAEDGRLKLDWPTRQKICVGIAKGLAFLHEESALRVVHRDIKATNILLDRDLNPKISDFGLAKLDEEENTHISTRVAGTIGYMAPEYALWGYLTYKADIYSFGVVALEIVAGKNNMKYRPNENYVCLVDWALVLQQKGNLMELVDPNLGSDFNMEEAVRIIKVAILCINPSPALRPTMSAVVNMLSGRTPVPELIMDPTIYGDELRLTAVRDQLNQISQQRTTESRSLIGSSDETQIDSSATSFGDAL
ncbi:GPCR kinase [Parasponia andersonii]|uniref:non-specific serine/threonine protein kinase n=1 Tax=Parasponia andersonii TaxID=3476 RepID=A0A2P5B260_PARAD|nr:GPCR kinase [Parasponia andersonii]